MLDYNRGFKALCILRTGLFNLKGGDYLNAVILPYDGKLKNCEMYRCHGKAEFTITCNNCPKDQEIRICEACVKSLAKTKISKRKEAEF